MPDQIVAEEKVVSPQLPLPLDHVNIDRQPGTPTQVLPPRDAGLTQILKAQLRKASNNDTDLARRATNLYVDDRFGSSPGTAVEPMCATSTGSPRRAAAISWTSIRPWSTQAGSGLTTWIGSSRSATPPRYRQLSRNDLRVEHLDHVCESGHQPVVGSSASRRQWTTASFPANVDSKCRQVSKPLASPGARAHWKSHRATL
jgi:hypothetical protein